MARFDVYANPNGTGYLLDVQADVLDNLSTRIVVPLLPSRTAPSMAKRLNPVFDIAEEPHLMVTQFMAAVQLSALRKPIGNLRMHDVEIGNALDLALIGF
ncbi:MAG: CcdB family protein [Pikeienuella sp.]